MTTLVESIKTKPTIQHLCAVFRLKSYLRQFLEVLFIYLFILRVKELTRGRAKFFNFKTALSNTLLPLDSATSSVTVCPIVCMSSFSSFSSPYIPSLQRA